MHVECGYIRQPDGHLVLELVLVQPTGIVEVHGGRAERDGGQWC